jgi:thiamine-monophosphate kinase
VSRAVGAVAAHHQRGRPRAPEPASEDELTRWLAERASARIGDDTVTLPEAPYSVTVDSQIAGVHVPCDLAPETVARRLLAVNLSDLAAAGVQPRFALLSLVAPAEYPRRAFLDALIDGLGEHGAELVGGDLARADRLVATLTLFGLAPPGCTPKGRAAALPGDRLWLGGPVGESALGQRLLGFPGALDRHGRARVPPLPAAAATLRGAARNALRRHLHPIPQLALGAWLARQPRAAVMDVSDGLSRDLERLCRRSGCGAELVATALGPPPGAASLARALGWDPLDLALAGGEDYVLLFALPADRRPPRRFRALEIGTITAASGLQLLTAAGERVAIAGRGWDHLAGGVPEGPRAPLPRSAASNSP